MMSAGMGYAYLMIFLATLLGAFVFGLVIQYLIRNRVKSSLIAGFAALLITSSMMRQEYSRTVYRMLFAVLSVEFVYPYIVLVFCGLVGASISYLFVRHLGLRDSVWQRMGSGRQGFAVGLLTCLVILFWARIPGVHPALILVAFPLFGFAVGRLVVGRTFGGYKLSFFNVSVVLFMAILLAHILLFESAKERREAFLEEHFVDPSVVDRGQLGIDVVNFFGGRFDEGVTRKIQISFDEPGGDYEGIVFLHDKACRYIQTVPPFPEVEVLNERRFAYDYRGTVCHVFLRDMRANPEGDTVHFTLEYAYNVVESAREQKTLEFLKTHINPDYLPSDLESHIRGDTYLRGGEYYYDFFLEEYVSTFNGKQYTRFNEEGDVVFVFEAWDWAAPGSSGEALAMAGDVVRSVPVESLILEGDTIEFEYDSLMGPRAAERFTGMYVFENMSCRVTILGIYGEYVKADSKHFPLIELVCA